MDGDSCRAVRMPASCKGALVIQSLARCSLSKRCTSRAVTALQPCADEQLSPIPIRSSVHWLIIQVTGIADVVSNSERVIKYADDLRKSKTVCVMIVASDLYDVHSCNSHTKIKSRHIMQHIPARCWAQLCAPICPKILEELTVFKVSLTFPWPDLSQNLAKTHLPA